MLDVDWNDFEQVKSLCKQINASREVQRDNSLISVVYKHPNRVNYNITFPENVANPSWIQYDPRVDH